MFTAGEEMYYAFIVNPIAGSGYANRVMDRLKEYLCSKHLSFKVFPTEHPSHATELAKMLSMDDEAEIVFSVGGDGTAYETACGLAGTDKKMGIIPAGTGNDFIKSTDIPRSPIEAMEFAVAHPAKSTDIGRVNDKFFLNVCGTGFDVTVLDYTLKLKKRFRGLLPYFLALLKAIFHYSPVNLSLTVDGEKKDGSYLICSIANGRFFGGGIPICPSAAIDDGKLDLILIQNVPRWKIPLYLPGLMMGKDLSFRITEHLRSEKIEMSAEHMRVNIDGEVLSMNSVTFEIRPKSIMLIR